MDRLENSNILISRPVKFIPLLILLLFSYAVISESAERFPLKYIGPEQDQAILRAQSLVMERRYSEATDLFDELEKKAPESLLAGMGRLLVVLIHSLEPGSPAHLLEPRLQQEIKKNRRLLKKLAKSKDLDAWSHFMMGGSLGAQGMVELERHHYFSAFALGLSSLSHFDKARRLDPEIHDISFATGLYKYYRSVKTRYLWFLPLISDQREEGIREIRDALERGHYAVPACKIALVVLAQQEGEDAEGIPRGKAFLEEYPRSLLIREALAKMLERQGRVAEAAHVYRDAYDGDRSLNWVLLRAGIRFLAANALDQAETSFLEYLHTDPLPTQSARAHLGLSRVYAKKGDESRSRAARERALVLDPTIEEQSDD